MQIILNTPLRDKLNLTVILTPPKNGVKNHLRIPSVSLPRGNLTTITNPIRTTEKNGNVIDENASAMDYFTITECLFLLLLHHSSLSSIKVIDG